jgi:gamma-glutamylcyclotransferase (GGCT)/AIG2-like uncharacterized protein YtfP
MITRLRGCDELERVLCFAYGSNMDEKQMTARCESASFVTVAELPRHRFIINTRGVATVLPNASHVVYGIAWRITKEDLEENLDRWEGVWSSLYERHVRSVVTSSGDPIEAWIYVATNSKVGSPRDGYMDRIVDAAQRHQLPPKYVEELKSWLEPSPQHS